MKLPLIVVASPLPGDALSLVSGRARVKIYRRSAGSEERLLSRVKNADGIITLLSDLVTDRVMEGCPQLKVISNYAVGTDNIDLVAAGRRGIIVTNTPEVLTEASADIAWTLILGTARRAVEGDRMVRSGRFRGWKPDLLLGMDLRDKTLGIVGMGRIGQAVARRAPAFGMRIIYSQRHRLPLSTEAALSAEYRGLDDLVAHSDIISLHCPLSKETTHLFDKKRLAAMKPGAILVNTSRGPVIDEQALVEGLKLGKPCAAGLDVYENEPALTRGLSSLKNVMLLPHLGSAGTETRAEMARMAVSDCLTVLEGKEPANRVV